jgi:D-aminopeptidase
MPPAQPAVAKPAPAPAMPAAPAKPPAKAAQSDRAGISRSDLQREIRKAVEEALRAQQAQKGQPVEVKINPPEITLRVVREEPSSAATSQSHPRREKLSDRELERRFKERLLQQEP